MKKSMFSLAILVLLFVFAFLLIVLKNPDSKLSQSEIGHAISFLFDFNDITVKISDDTNPDLVTIEWNGAKVYQNGNKQKVSRDVRYFYGTNNFKVFYDGKEIFHYCQSKLNNWHYHHYEFRIVSNGELLKCELMIHGPDKDYCV